MPPAAGIFLILLHHKKRSIAFTWRGLCNWGWQEGEAEPPLRRSLTAHGLCGVAKPSLTPNSSKFFSSAQKTLERLH